jgi:hypothetical protein
MTMLAISASKPSVFVSVKKISWTTPDTEITEQLPTTLQQFPEPCGFNAWGSWILMGFLCGIMWDQIPSPQLARRQPALKGAGFQHDTSQLIVEEQGFISHQLYHSLRSHPTLQIKSSMPKDLCVPCAPLCSRVA